jgi:hypothetical protein
MESVGKVRIEERMSISHSDEDSSTSSNQEDRLMLKRSSSNQEERHILRRNDRQQIQLRITESEEEFPPALRNDEGKEHLLIFLWIRLCSGIINAVHVQRAIQSMLFFTA